MPIFLLQGNGQGLKVPPPNTHTHTHTHMPTHTHAHPSQGSKYKIVICRQDEAVQQRRCFIGTEVHVMAQWQTIQ